MFVVIGILFFIAWLATFFFKVALWVTYGFLFLAILSIVIHFITVARRRRSAA